MPAACFRHERNLSFISLFSFWPLIVLGISAIPISPLAAAVEGTSNSKVEITGELKPWHVITLSFTGPERDEQGNPNPFLDYRLTVRFTQGHKIYRIPGYFAADGHAAESGATRGNRWRAHFVPDAPGRWQYTTEFVTKTDIAILPLETKGEPFSFNGAWGAFDIHPSDKTGRDFRAKGFLRHAGGRYLRFSGNGEYFLKGGADSPENFLAYEEFDQTFRTGDLTAEAREGEAKSAGLHRYEPHAGDWRPGDPTWRDGKGKNIIGALNYLAGKGMNSVYFLTMNVKGDGNDVWPWTGPDERFRFDCSKLDQWEIVFTHMDRLGLLLHVITQETENDQLLDGGDLGRERKLYYRELTARFGHHLGLVWNLGEENTNTTEQRQAFVEYIGALDPYGHPIVLHTYPGGYEEAYTPLLELPGFTGPSLQMGDMKETHAETIKWIARSTQTGHPWAVFLDEIGPSHTGVKPDAEDPEHREIRQHALWGNLMAGGAGVEWYFGYRYAHNDLNCEDWRSRDRMWDYTRYALEFFQRHLPFPEMTFHDELTSLPDDYCLAKEGEIYAIYLPNGSSTELTLPGGTYTVRWYDPRQGGELREGTVAAVTGPGNRSLGEAPESRDQDWVALVRKSQ
ncbi:MAG: DUF5060 domain-containing protein [bacterium]